MLPVAVVSPVTPLNADDVRQDMVYELPLVGLDLGGLLLLPGAGRVLLLDPL